MTRLLCTRIFVSVTNKESLTVALAASWRTTVTLVLFDGLEMLQYMVELADRAGVLIGAQRRIGGEVKDFLGQSDPWIHSWGK